MKKKKYKCEICGKKFKTERGLSIHKSKSHDRSLEKITSKEWFVPALILLMVAIVILLPIRLPIEENKVQKPSSLIKIQSPSNITYNQRNIILNVSCGGELCSYIKDRINDGDLSGVTCGNGLPCVVEGDEDSFVEECTGCYGFTRYNLEFEEGTHKLTIRAKDENNREYEKTVVFTVDV